MVVMVPRKKHTKKKANKMLPYGKLICDVIRHTAAGNMPRETGIKTVIL